MHFALPPRKASHPLPYARKPPPPPNAQRNRRQLQILGYVTLSVLTFLLVLKYFWSSGRNVEDGPSEIEGRQDIVIVTVFNNDTMSDEYMRMIRSNRDHYASRHGYHNFYTNTAFYADLVEPSPSSWSLIPALRHALTVYPRSTFFWSLSADALITTPSLSLEEHILQPLESLMHKDVPVVPPDSVIHTFSRIKPSRTRLVISQDANNLADTSFIVRNTPPSPTSSDSWAQYFLDAWFDPLYRAYAFQKAQTHALEHLVQWHPTILAKLVLIDQRRMNSYNFASPPSRDPVTRVARSHDSMWQEGDLVVNFKGCRDDEKRNCQEELREYFSKWERDIVKLDTSPVDHAQTPRPERAVVEGKT
ncbi:hypothetical protein B0A52_00064 [Exophiala mesophila]|uniref:Uncharacterized protein n=1 Tax=Exophiala mesophila TaxID=212818 RepID=A0A438NJ01_EXOME|nr:hypothetical protein B0A52_00064 [Exophiala mesophila]